MWQIFGDVKIILSSISYKFVRARINVFYDNIQWMICLLKGGKIFVVLLLRVATPRLLNLHMEPLV